MTVSLRDAALSYADRGMPVFPLYPRGKRPLTPNGFKDATTDEKMIRLWWKKYPDANIGLYPGGAGLAVLDVDGPAGRDWATDSGWCDIPTPRVTTAKGEHLYFRCISDTPVPNAKPHPEVDVRGDNGYVVAPPSVHESGHVYEWVDEGLDFAPFPMKLLEAVGQGSEASDEPGTIGKGSRNTRLMSFGGGMRRLGLDEKGICGALSAINEAACDPPLSEREVREIAASVARYRPGNPDDVIQRINAGFAHLLNGGKSVILRIHEDGSWDTMRWQDFSRLIKNWPPVQVGPKSFKGAADYWLEHPDRRDYPGGIVFEPGKARTPGAFNLFTGWAWEPRPGGKFDLLRDHIRTNVARGDPRIEAWILSFFAHIFQAPDQKSGTALALRGRQGTGKSILGRCLGALMGPHYQVASDRRYLVGNFNAHLEGTLLFQLEEAVWPGDKQGEGVLKDLITGMLHLRERKYQDPVQVDNHVRVVLTSNESWVVPAGSLDRRFTVLDMGEDRMQDDEYFGEMVRQLEQEGGYEGLLHFMLNYPIDWDLIRKPVRTEALSEQIAHSYSPIEEWWFDLLEDGVLPGDVKANGICHSSTLFSHYVESVGRNVKRHAGKTRLGMFLSQKVPGLQKSRVTSIDSNRRVPVYEFPSLAECRAAFDPARSWPEPEDWQEWVEPF